MEEPSTTKRPLSPAEPGGESNKKVAADAGVPVDASGVKVKVEDEYEAETDEDDDERKPPTQANAVGGAAIKQEDGPYGAETDDDGNGKEGSSDAEDEGKDAALLKSFPQGCQSYKIVRVAGGEVLQHVEESHAKGMLEIDSSSDGKSAKFWVECPDNHGVIAGRIDAGSFEGRPPTFFRAVASTAYLDYGMWSGPLSRDGDMPGAHFGGTMFVMGLHAATAGNEEFSSDDPLHIQFIHSFEVKKDEPVGELPTTIKVADDYHDHFLKKGDIGFVLFVEDGESNYGCGGYVPVPVGLWFRPLEPSEVDSAAKIPAEILSDIDKLPQFSEEAK